MEILKDSVNNLIRKLKKEKEVTFILIDNNGKVFNSGKADSVYNLVYDFDYEYNFVSVEDLVKEKYNLGGYKYVALFDGDNIIAEKGDIYGLVI